MAIEPDWSCTDLDRYLRYDFWPPYKAFRVLAGLDFRIPEDDSDLTYPLGYGMTGDGLHRMGEMKGIVSSLKEYWENGKHEDNEKHPPAFFIEWAMSKGHRPEWLDWAIKQRLYSPKQGADKPESIRKTQNLLRALTCIAIDDYGYDPKDKKSPAPTDVANALSKHGCQVDPKTIRGWLKEGVDLLPPIPHKD